MKQEIIENLKRLIITVSCDTDEANERDDCALISLDYADQYVIQTKRNIVKAKLENDSEVKKLYARLVKERDELKDTIEHEEIDSDRDAIEHYATAFFKDQHCKKQFKTLSDDMLIEHYQELQDKREKHFEETETLECKPGLTEEYFQTVLNDYFPETES